MPRVARGGGTHTSFIVRARADRRLATVLFVDIVDSTRIATELGDHRWRDFLGAFRRAVRHELKREGGHEEDTAGDGFFATFGRPAGAVRCAAAIVGRAQGIGVDVRCGVHTGELERIDGRLGGIAAHIGARVISVAGPAEVLVTATVHDLVVGGGIEFVSAGETDLRGVPGTWTLYRATEIDGFMVPPPLEADAAVGRRRVLDVAPARRSVRPAVFGLALVGGVVAAAIGALILTLPDEEASGAATPAAPDRPASMIRIDAATNEVVAKIQDKYLVVGGPGDAHALIVDGTLWQITPINVVRRDMATGRALEAISKPENTYRTWFAFGSLWFETENIARSSRSDLQRVDPLSGRTVATIAIEKRARGIAIGRDAIYVLTRDREVLEIDPETNEFVDMDVLPIDTIPDEIVAVGSNVWICECDEGRIIQWNPDRDVVMRTAEFAQRGFIIEDRREASQGSVSLNDNVVWLLDGFAATITPVDTISGEAGQPIGIPRNSSSHDFGAGAVWISADTSVFRLDIETGEGTTIELPDGINAGGIAVDDATGAVWLTTYAEGVTGP